MSIFIKPNSICLWTAWFIYKLTLSVYLGKKKKKEGDINGYSNNIGLENIYRNFWWEKKQLNFLIIFLFFIKMVSKFF